MKGFGTVEQALEELRAGRIIMVTDDEDRENEGDFICAAEFADQANVNFMASVAKGLICMPMSEAFCRKLQFPQMVMENTDNHETAFTVSIDYVGTSTTTSSLSSLLPASLRLRRISLIGNKARPSSLLSAKVPSVPSRKPVIAWI